MVKKELKEKIENGTIKIENGELVGLGFKGQTSIDIGKLEDLISIYGKGGVVDVLGNAVAGIGIIHTALCKYDGTEDEEIRHFIDNELRMPLSDINVWGINLISKLFID